MYIPNDVTNQSTMSTSRPPTERRSGFNPQFYKNSETGTTLDDLDTKVSVIVGYAYQRQFFWYSSRPHAG